MGDGLITIGLKGMTEKTDGMGGLKKNKFPRTSTIHIPFFLLDTSHVSFLHGLY